jgi:hypothetical protein
MKREGDEIILTMDEAQVIWVRLSLRESTVSGLTEELDSLIDWGETSLSGGSDTVPE